MRYDERSAFTRKPNYVPMCLETYMTYMVYKSAQIPNRIPIKKNNQLNLRTQLKCAMMSEMPLLANQIII